MSSFDIFEGYKSIRISTTGMCTSDQSTVHGALLARENHCQFNDILYDTYVSRRWVAIREEVAYTVLAMCEQAGYVPVAIA
jgi:hypothetical protein